MPLGALAVSEGVCHYGYCHAGQGCTRVTGCLVLASRQWRGWCDSLGTLAWAVVHNRMRNVVYLWALAHWQRGGKRETVITVLVLGTYAMVPVTLRPSF